jgi:hypothetical protein
MSAALIVAVWIVLGWAVARAGRRRRRWREAERLSRCLFAAAGVRRRYR